MEKFKNEEEKRQQFHKELKGLLKKYNAEITLQDFGRNWCEDNKIVVSFSFDEEIFNITGTGIIEDLILGYYEDGK